jgi:hypothetical protein
MLPNAEGSVDNNKTYFILGVMYFVGKPQQGFKEDGINISFRRVV